MRKKIEIQINDSKEEFKFGCCATVAISAAFNMNAHSIAVVLRLLKFKEWYDGLTFFQIKRLINVLDPVGRWTYVPNNAQVRYNQLIILFKDKSLIVMFSEHLSYVEKGQIYDSYLINALDREGWINAKPTGWWIKP